MNTEKSRYLTEAMGLCWHNRDNNKNNPCQYCGTFNKKWFDFSTWQGFGTLWEWAIKQEWWDKFLHRHDPFYGLNKKAVPPFFIEEGLINPEKFANAIFKFLKERE